MSPQAPSPFLFYPGQRPGVVDSTIHLLWGTDLMLVVAVVGSLLAWALAGWLQVRAAVPHASGIACLVAGPRLLFGRLMEPEERTGPRPIPMVGSAEPSSVRRVRADVGPVPSALAAAGSAASLVVLGPAVGVGAALLFGSGHVPPGRWQAVLLTGSGVAVAAAVAVVVQTLRREDRKPWLAARGPHLVLAVAVGELLLVAACVAVALVITHTEGTDLSLLDAGCAAVVARAVTTLRLPAGGAVVADVVFVSMLVGAGLSVPAALAIVVVWRAAAAAAWMVGITAPLHPRLRVVAPLALSQAPTGSALGERFHRLTFRALGALPSRFAAPARTRLFETLFSLSSDPWRYDTLPYEQRKRAVLVAHVPGPQPSRHGAWTIVEIGCADGHNLEAIAEEHPSARVIGLDISPTAVAAALARTRACPNVTVLRSDARGAADALASAGVGHVDVLVVAEVLYYLGSPAQVGAELAPLATTLAAGASAVLVHQRSDAARLHPPALVALDVGAVERITMEDDERPYVIEIARR